MTQQKYLKDEQTAIANKCYSFRLSYDLMDKKRQQAFRNEVLSTFGFVNRASFYNRMKGEIEFSAREKEMMDIIFAKHNMKWDYEHENGVD